MRKIISIILPLLLIASVLPMAIPNASAAGPVNLLWSSEIEVYEVAVSKDGKYIATASWEEVYFFASNNPTPIWIFETESNEEFISVAISADGDSVVAGTVDGYIYYWADARTGSGDYEPVWSSTDLWGEVEPGTLVISDNGEYVAVGGTGDTLYYFADCLDRSGIGEDATWTDYEPFPNGDIRAVDMTPDGRYVVAGGDNHIDYSYYGIVAFWKDANEPTHSLAWYYNDTAEYIIDVAVSDDGYAVAALDEYDQILYWHDAYNLSGEIGYDDWCPGGDFSSMDMSSDGDKVVAGSDDEYSPCLHYWRDVKARALEHGDEEETWIRLEDVPITECAISDDGKIIAALQQADYDQPGEVYIFTSEGALLGNHTLGEGYYDSLSMSGYGGIVAVGGGEYSLYVFSTGAGAPSPFQYAKVEIDSGDYNETLVTEIYPLPSPKKISVYVEIEAEGDYTDFDGVYNALEDHDEFRIWVELYMNGTWKPLISQQQYDLRIPRFLLSFDDGYYPEGVVLPPEPFFYEPGKWIVGDIAHELGDISIPNLLIGEVLLLEDQVPVAEGMRVYIEREDSDGGDVEVFTFQTVVQGFGEESIESLQSEITSIKESINSPEYGLGEIKSEVRSIEGAVYDDEYGLPEIKSEVRSIEADMDNVTLALNEIFERLGIPVGGLIFPASLSSLLNGAFPYLLALAVGLIGLAAVTKKTRQRKS